MKKVKVILFSAALLSLMISCNTRGGESVISWPDSWDDTDEITRTIETIRNDPGSWDALIEETTAEERGRGFKEGATENPFLLDNGNFLIIAHRCGGAIAPEETREAWVQAMKDGADTLEGDIHSTRDGFLVLSHDADLSRCTDIDGKIADLTFQEVRAADAGYNFTPDDGVTYPFRGKGLKVPLLSECLTFLKYRCDDSGTPLKNDKGELIPRDRPIPMLLEIKAKDEELVDRVYDEIDRFEIWDSLVVSFSTQKNQDRLRARLGEEGKGAVTLLTIKESIVFTAVPSYFLKKRDYTPPARLFASHYIAVNRCLIEKAAEFDMRIDAWTVNSEPVMRYLLSQGCISITTDDCPKLIGVMSE